MAPSHRIRVLSCRLFQAHQVGGAGDRRACALVRWAPTEAAMAPPQRIQVLRCCSCRLFQAHQVKKSLKWTCKACGEKQSFLRVYGEGTGADCRRHVQKLNLLQGQVSEMSLRSLEGPVNASTRENASQQQAEKVSLQGRSQSLENRWLKYLEKDSKDLGLEELEVCSSRQLSSQTKEPDPPFSKDRHGKRKWGLSTVQPPDSPGAWDSVTRGGGSKVTLQPQGCTGLTVRVQAESSNCLQDWKPPSPAQQIKFPSSKWEHVLPPPGNSSQVDTEPPRPMQTGPRPASPGGGRPSRAPQVPWASHPYLCG